MKDPTQMQPPETRWMRLTLRLAAAYNLIWGALVIAMPGLMFQLAGIEPPRYPQIWQCVGMIVGVYGIGYAIAATDPLRHWPIVLVGLLGKIFGPLGFAYALLTGALPPAFGATILTNDLVWIVPFALILRAAYRNWRDVHADLVEQAPAPEILLDIARTSDGRVLADLSREGTVMLVFLRHFGCAFCREAAADLALARPRIEASGIRLVAVHMGAEADAIRFFRHYGLDDLPHVSDPSSMLYRSFRLQRGRLDQLFGPRVVRRGWQAARAGHRLGNLAGDVFQMPGIFLVRDGQLVGEYRHRTAADRPDYIAFATGGDALLAAARTGVESPAIN